jgi:hypothetical protein
MPISLFKKPIVLVVQDFRIGIESDDSTQSLLKQSHLSKLADLTSIDNFHYVIETFTFDNIHSEAVDSFRAMSESIYSSPPNSIITPATLALINDVVNSLNSSSTAHEIRLGLKEKILQIYRQGNPLYLVAQGLSSVIAFDTVNDLMKNPAYFDRRDPLTWPVQGLLTLGSPLAAELFNIEQSREITSLGKGPFVFNWRNYFDTSDPFALGQVFGSLIKNNSIESRFMASIKQHGWFVKDYPIYTPVEGYETHSAYWDNSDVGEALLNMML